MSTSDGGPAFPTDVEGVGRFSTDWHHTGMGLRDYFAAKAMTALMGCLGAVAENGEPMYPGGRDAVARAAYMVADAMIAEREKQP